MHSLIRNVLSKNSIIQLLLGLAGNTQRQQIPMQSFKAIRAVDNDYLRHEFSDRQIPKVLLMCLTKICRTFIRKLWNFLRQEANIVAQTLALGVWQGIQGCRLDKCVWLRSDLGSCRYSQLFWLEFHRFNKQEFIPSSSEPPICELVR
jgi:hypothetical protein